MSVATPVEVLYVEDEDIILELVIPILEEPGFGLTVAVDGIGAFDLLDRLAKALMDGWSPSALGN